MAQQKPIDLIKATAIDLDISLSEYNRKECHHVFPKAFLAKQLIPSNRINSILNFCFLPSDSNKRISNKEPKFYFFNLVPQIEFKMILESNILPIDQNIYLNNDFALFMEKRAERIINLVEDYSN